MNGRIDAAAADAGRRPEDIRRMLNLIGGPFEPGKLAELTARHGFSTYILAADAADDVRRFAEEVAPATRELVAQARGGS